MTATGSVRFTPKIAETAMVSFQYKGRIHKSKLSVRSVRYALTDRLVRAMPALGRRWLFPVEGMPIAKAAAEDIALPSMHVTDALPHELERLRIPHKPPLQIVHHVYRLIDVHVTGWAGAMIQHGLLLTVRPNHNWVSGLRPEPYRRRALPASVAYYNLMAPIPARGHMFHWLYDGIVPLLSFLEHRGAEGEPLGLLVNAQQSDIQKRTIAYICERYGIAAVETLAQREAVHAPTLLASVPVPYDPRGLQSPLGLAKLEDLGAFLATPADAEVSGARKKLYISRNDARLRRVSNEEQLLPVLREAGFERVILKGLPIAEQVRLFRQADVVIGPHGAGFAHITWCKPGAKVVEFFPDPSGPRGRVKNASADYWLISKTRGLEYDCRFAGPSLNRDDRFEIPMETFETVLKTTHAG